MSLFSLPKTYGSLQRLRQIAGVMARHGYGHILGKLRLDEYLPGWMRLRALSSSESEPAVSPPQRMAAALQELGATFIKFGQLLATRPDLIPQEYAEAFGALQDHVDPADPEAIAKVLSDSLGDSPDVVFVAFDATPLASGSIGQAHAATLLDGTDVIVKVKRPDTDRRVRQDLTLLLWLADKAQRHLPELAKYHPKIICEEFADTMRRELDFVTEASYTAKMAEECAEVEGVVIPTVYWDYVTHDTMVVERLQGTPLSVIVRDTSRSHHPELAKRVANVFLHQYFKSGLFHADPHPGNLFLLEDGRLGMIDFGQTGRLSNELRRQLAIAVIAMSHADADTLTDILADVGVLSDDADVRSFKSQLALLLDRYFGVPLDRIDIGRAFEDIMTVSRQHGVLLPRDFVLLGKSLVTITSVTRLLDPHFRVDDVARPYAAMLAKDQLRPKDMLRNSGFFLYQIASFIRRAPEDLRDLLQKARTGKLRVIFHHEALEVLSSRIDVATTRLSIALVLAAIIVGSSLILSSQGIEAHHVPALGGMSVGVLMATGGFGVAMLLGLYLIWNIIRSGRL